MAIGARETLYFVPHESVALLFHLDMASITGHLFVSTFQGERGAVMVKKSYFPGVISMATDTIDDFTR